MAPTSDSKLKQTKALRQLQIDSINDLLTLAQSAVTDESLHTRFKISYVDVDVACQEFQKHHSAVIAMMSTQEQPDYETEKKIRTSFCENYYTIKTVYANLFTVSRMDASLLNENREQKSSNLKLPKISLPIFDGNYKNWMSYYDLFKTLIHDNKSLSEIEKFQYLLSSLSCQALNLIKNIPISSDNYAIAFDTLEKRYQNRRLLANSCWQEIMGAQRLTSDSVTGLRKLLEIFAENLSALKTLNLPVDQWDFVLYHLLIQKLDISTLKRFELKEASIEIPSYSLLKDFLLHQCTALETVAFSTSSSQSKKPYSSSMNASKPRSSFLTQSTCPSYSAKTNATCNFCKSPHSIYKCSSFSNKSPSERLKIAKERNWCLNCLHSGHRIDSCSSKSTCRLCHSRHHSLIHTSSPSEVHSKVTTSETNPIVTQPYVGHVQSLCSTPCRNNCVLLSTALIEVRDAKGSYQTVRAIIDAGSQTNVISQKCANRLALRSSDTPISILGLGQMSSSVSGSIVCTIRPRGCVEPSYTIDALVLPKICADMPNSFVRMEQWQYLSNLPLADPHFNIPSPVDMLLSAEIFSLILRDGKVSGKETEPVAVNTAFGWILLGRVGSHASPSGVSSLFTALESSLDSTFKRFWEIEEIPRAPMDSAQDMICEKSFVDTHFREVSGRYSVNLPFKGPEPVFSDSRSMALRRFYSLERRLLRDTTLYISYCDILRDYLDQGHMELANSSVENGMVFYIPHHLVINPNSSTSKHRIVFDASAKAVDGVSLNDTLLIGPKLQKDIVTLLLHFRLHNIVFTADIKQMYRNINLNSKHRDYQRILFRFSPDDIVQEYRLNTVTFGVSSSPFLALRTIQQLTSDEGEQFPLAAEVLRSDTFVDDIVTGVSSVTQAAELKKQLDSILKRGGFSLRKWTSNCPEFLENIPEELRHSQPLSFSEDTNAVVNILGLRYFPRLDMFSYAVKPLDRPCTKRTMLSELARTYDPLGFLSPITFSAKFLIQHLWTLGLDWDQTPPSDVIAHWNKYKSQLPCFSDLKIPRRILKDNFTSCQLHGFCDSSEKGYSAVIYFRFQFSDETTDVSLICAKTKVAPLAKLSLPRLELCAALLLAKLIDFTLHVYAQKLSFSNIFAWSDSTVTLSWIRSPPYKFKTFVANRVSEIQSLVSPTCWNHVSSADNPADCASRGLYPLELLNHTLWWSGPSWLGKNEHFWPKNSVDFPDGQLSSSSAFHEEERKIALSSFVSLETIDLLLNKFSLLEKIKRILCYCLRFIRNAKTKQLTNKSDAVFTAQDLHEALLVLVKHVQHSSFPDVIDSIQTKRAPPKPFRKLSPFLDRDGVLRVGGRLAHSGLVYDQKYPALLPRQHRLTELIIEDVHRKNFHPGLQTLHFLLLQNFWILSPRRAIRNILSKCLKCFRVNPKPFQPSMGNLPAVRVNQVKPFQYVGVDFGGPFLISLTKSRGIKCQKAYLCLFVCFVTKALHLELASDLTSECFIAALRRFISRRGRCTNLFSDRGTNFVGAEKELCRLMQQASEAESIQWSFNPPSAPHFGGLWESGIKSVKSHLLRVVGKQILTYEEFYTLLVQIEAVLNSRPLCPLSSDAHDLSVLTPGHFLTLEPLTSVPDPDLSHLSLSRLSRWQLLQKLHQDFWRRWHLEYLNTLQQKRKWNHTDSSSVKPGMLVLIKDDLAPPLKWRLGRLEQVHPGSDGVCRVATVKTIHGSVQRPVVKLCPLPIDCC